jgi:endonuclease/exonuclease/phosphatase family metal-dependent hydrolase
MTLAKPLLLAVLALCLSLAPRASAQDALRLRVLTYNIHHGEGTDGRLDLARIARVIAAQNPDLVALQEVDVKTQRTGGVDQPAELARLTGMHAAFGRGIDFQGGEYGNAVLSRFPITATKVHSLPVKEGEERRCALVVIVRPWEGRPQAPGEVTFVGTHLNHRDEAERIREADEINRLLVSNADNRPTILAGDLNAQPHSEAMKRFLPHWKDAAAEASAGNAEAAMTFPAAKPVRRIDYVLLRPAGAWRVIETKVVAEPVASDHRPVLAVVEWKARADRDKAKD